VLRTRILTALIIAPLAVAALYLLPAFWFAVAYGLVAALGAYEWGGLIGLRRFWSRLAYAALFVVAAGMTWWLDRGFGLAIVVGSIVWIVAAGLVLTYPATAAVVREPWSNGLLGLFVLWGAWSAVVEVRGEPGSGGANWVMWLLVLVWSADVGAYFAGRRFGRRKLAPAVSPGKTWEGAFGGMLVSLALCGGALLVLGLPAWWLLAVAGLVVVSIFGDLFESVIKRVRGVKDSSNLLPGHGGILDRIDSLLAVLPVFALILAR
jgi:phosphatidate cytidylyltransferase